MIKNVIARFSNRKINTILLTGYFLISFYTAFQSKQSTTSMQILTSVFGGDPVGIMDTNLPKFILWFLTFFPLLLLIGLPMTYELSGRCYYTMIRMKSQVHWWNNQFFSASIFTLIFSVTVFGIVTTFAMLSGNNQSLVSDIPNFIATFFLYAFQNLFYVGWMLALSILFINMKTVLVTILIIVISSYSLGRFLPNANIFLIGTYSMINRSSFLDSIYGLSTMPALAVMLIFILLSYLIGRWKLHRICYKIST